MAQVKIVASNIFAGASLKKQEPGSIVEVPVSLAEHWVNAGLAENVEQKADPSPKSKKDK